MAKKYWCLFCGENGPRWGTFEELLHHMETTVHKSENGDLVIPMGKWNES